MEGSLLFRCERFGCVDDFSSDPVFSMLLKYSIIWKVLSFNFVSLVSLVSFLYFVCVIRIICEPVYIFQTIRLFNLSYSISFIPPLCPSYQHIQSSIPDQHWTIASNPWATRTYSKSWALLEPVGATATYSANPSVSPRPIPPPHWVSHSLHYS